MNKLFLFIIAVGFSSFAQAKTQTTAELEAQLQAKPDSMPVREQLARAYTKEKNWKKVIETLNSYTDEASPRGFLNLATAYQETGKVDDLVRVFTLLADKRSEDPVALYLLADAKMKKAQTLSDLTARQKTESESIQKYREAIKHKRKFAMAHQALLTYFLNVRMHHEAREQAREMLTVFGPKSDVLPVLCRLYAMDGYLPQAVDFCQRAMQIHKKLPDSHMYLAQTYFDQKELDKAESTLVKAAKQFQSSEFAQYGAGQFFLNKGNFPVAAKYLARAVAIDANSSRSQSALAKAYFEAGQPEQALPHFKLACKLNPEIQETFQFAATKLRLKGDKSALAQQYAQAAGSCSR